MYTRPETYRRDCWLGALGAAVSTWNFMLSQGSGNAALLLWMVSNAVWERRTDAVAPHPHG